MALFLVLEDFSDGSATLSAGSVIDSTAFDLARLQASGLAALSFNPSTMEASRLAFLAARGSRVVEPDTSGDLMALLIASGAVPTGVASVGASSPLVSSGGPNPVLSIAPGTTAGDVVKWNGLVWTTGTTDVGITELTGDVTAGPGNGVQNASVVALQGTPVSAVAPSVDGQVLTWNGAEWVAGTQAAGGSGGGGVVYYLNAGTAAAAPTIGLPGTPKELGVVAEVPLSTITSGTLPNDGSWILVAGFVTNPATPGTVVIPAGLWDFNVWATSSSNQVNATRFRVKVYTYDGAVAPTLIATGTSTPLFDPTQTVQYACSVLLPQTAILATDRVYIEIEAQASVGGHTITVSFGDNAPTHVHTTLSSVTGTGLVHVINGVIQSPATPVDFGAGPTEITGTLPIGNGGTGLATTPADGQLLIGRTATTDYALATLTAGSGISITNGAGSITVASTGGGAIQISLLGEVTGNTPAVLGAFYLSSATTFAATSRVLAGVVGAGTTTVRLVEQATSTVVATWTTAAAIGDVTLGAPTALLAAGWYAFDLAGSGAGTVTRCYGAFLEV